MAMTFTAGLLLVMASLQETFAAIVFNYQCFVDANEITLKEQCVYLQVHVPTSE